jgi:HD-GYP domain-containing protein (c-di-GMP phosphodiesterase class II)
VPDDIQRATLAQASLYAEESRVHEWKRRIAAAMDQRIRQGAALKDVVQARAEEVQVDRGERRRSIAEEWFELRSRLDAALRQVRADSVWAERVDAVQQRARELAARSFDESLFHVVHEAEHFSEKYSAQHALMTLLIAENAATLLGFEPDEITSLGRAALTMNVAMHRLQDLLALTEFAPTPEQRREIDQHPQRGAAQLTAAGLQDKLAVEVVAFHHHQANAALPLAALAPAQRLARLLRRVDLFGAKISRRASRAAMSPIQAAREACLGSSGTPDEIGGALLKTVGIYPPGSFVELASGEVGVVIARGRRANLPLVAGLVSASGNVFADPPLRDTLDRRHAVKGAVLAARVKVRFAHDKVLALAANAQRLH